MKVVNSTENYQVVVNLQNEYSIWPECKELPVGWRSTGMSGCKQECLNYVTELCTQTTPCDMRALEAMCLTQETECCIENAN